jgi:2-oxoglutarate dehydrogenase E1 component
MSPKSLLRHKLAVSNLSEMGPDTGFARVIPETDSIASDEKVQRLLLCSGKVYYDLVQERRNREIDNVAIVRVEQLYPWPRQSVLDQIERYPNAQVVWCQEEAANMGAWTFVLPRLINILEGLDREVFVPTYVGRKAAS